MTWVCYMVTGLFFHNFTLKNVCKVQVKWHVMQKCVTNCTGRVTCDAWSTCRLWSPTTLTNYLLSTADVLWSCNKCRGSQKHCYLTLCLLSGVTVTSQKRPISYWKTGVIIVQPVSHELFTTSSPVTTYYTTQQTLGILQNWKYHQYDHVQDKY